MKKVQKIWLWVFFAMFLVPEILWSPAGNFVYSWYMPLLNGSVQTLRNNILLKVDNYNLYSAILFVQFLGLFAAFLMLVGLRKKIYNKQLLWSGLVLSLLFSVILLFCFGLSVSLRHIGF